MKNLLLIVLLIGFGLQGQNTMTFLEDTVSADASISQMEWMTGHWKGEAFGGVTEEIWSPPAAGVMMFVFRLIAKGEINFYEIGHIREVDNTLVFELKHFDKDLKGWEEKDEVQRFRLIKVAEDRLYFDGFTFEKVGPNEINIYGLIHQNDGSAEEIKFNYKRQ
ncbi:DUF6265 family protein [Maribacter aestuarii]|uniref:DUF6265 family protein n=1 Tax=Maribacter aestuarii TaxID=1130723 RepID=UPI00248CA1F3|nr:DUF6265 family protein [Maribacter aestuarii]